MLKRNTTLLTLNKYHAWNKEKYHYKNWIIHIELTYNSHGIFCLAKLFGFAQMDTAKPLCSLPELQPMQALYLKNKDNILLHLQIMSRIKWEWRDGHRVWLRYAMTTDQWYSPIKIPWDDIVLAINKRRRAASSRRPTVDTVHMLSTYIMYLTFVNVRLKFAIYLSFCLSYPTLHKRQWHMNLTNQSIYLCFPQIY